VIAKLRSGHLTLWHEPGFILAGLTFICLLIFWVTIPLPRIDNQLVGSDGTYYYIYLPSFWLDGDLDLTDEYSYFINQDQEKLASILSSEKATPTGLPANQWSVGTAIFWSPFFLLAHILANILQPLGVNVSKDGNGYLYQAIVLSGSIIYGGLGLWFVYRFTAALTSKKAALYGTSLVMLAGNVIYYMTAEPSMSHNVSLFLSGLFFYTWLQRRHRPGLKTAVLYGLLGGAMALVRPQDVLLIILPFLADLPAVWSSLRGQASYYPWQMWLRDGFVTGLVALFVFSPQFLVWGKIYGDYFTNPYLYGENDVLFYWFSPKLFRVLFSAHRGLFVWNPVFLLGLVGLWFTYRREPTFAILSLVGFAMQLYLISSWHSWFQGDAFGGRMFIVCTPIFVLGLSSLVDYAANRWSWKLLYALAAIIIAWNFLLLVEYRFDLVTAQQPPTWYDLTIRRLTFLTES